MIRTGLHGAVVALVADHIVQARVIFPGAGYLEHARASVCAAMASKSSGLYDIVFLQPLVVKTHGATIECEVTEGRFDIRSVDDSEAAEGAVHC